MTVTGGGNCSIAAARDAMGIDWMTKKEINEAIPPGYTEYVGRYAMMAAATPAPPEAVSAQAAAGAR